MLQSEYDEMLADPNGFAIKKLWPRICYYHGTFKPFYLKQRRNLPLLSSVRPLHFPGLPGRNDFPVRAEGIFGKITGAQPGNRKKRSTYG